MIRSKALILEESLPLLKGPTAKETTMAIKLQYECLLFKELFIHIINN